ncbi:MAG: SMP-30/gluconolactonase/LRE family protein [Phycisphaerae bacterium]|nr:SMP-30/gluconolactonase/LRE family protein [Phycisphaerae bacterium]
MNGKGVPGKSVALIVSAIALIVAFHVAQYGCAPVASNVSTDPNTSGDVTTSEEPNASGDDAAAEEPNASGDDDSTAEEPNADDDDTTTEEPNASDDDTPTDEPEEPFYVITGPRATEDLGFDDKGYLLGAQDGNIFRTAYNGTPEIVLAGAGGGGHRLITGIMMLPDGDIIYCDDQSGSMYRADLTTGAKQVVLSGLSYPNGLEMDLSGLVYLAETHANRIRRINVDTGVSATVVSGVPGPDGVSFNPDYDTLYISSSSNGTIYAVDIDATGQAGQLRVLASGFPSHLNAVAVDVNGDIYIAAVQAGQIWRLTPDGQTRTLLAQANDMLASVQWGSGIGGWDAKTLYIANRQSSDRIHALYVGVEGKHRLYP